MSRLWRVPYKHGDGQEDTIVVQTSFPWEAKSLAKRILFCEEDVKATFAEGIRDIVEVFEGGES